MVTLNNLTKIKIWSNLTGGLMNNTVEDKMNAEVETRAFHLAVHMVNVKSLREQDT